MSDSYGNRSDESDDEIREEEENEGQSEEVAETDEFFHNFNGKIQSENEEKRTVVEIFCRNTNDKFQFSTDDEGNFKIQMEAKIKWEFHKCTTGLRMAFYKKKVMENKVPKCLPIILRSPKRKLKNAKRLDVCVVPIRIKWLKFGPKKSAEEAETDENDDILRNEFAVDFDAEKNAKINGQIKNCNDLHSVEPNFEMIFNKYFDDGKSVDEEGQSLKT
ncbi:hypothetical protein niasHT_027339 [Heterodera trifolii]|uniref:Uncharacterized protein n=1 Tax=Heterodera trifolii TaxID=157864 RepID=A0ABD2JTP6_9BILA